MHEQDVGVERALEREVRGVRDARARLAIVTGGDDEACIVARHGGAWRVRRPLWESLVHLRSRAGEADLAPVEAFLRQQVVSQQATITVPLANFKNVLALAIITLLVAEWLYRRRLNLI